MKGKDDFLKTFDHNIVESDESTTSSSDSSDKFEDLGEFKRRFLNVDSSTCWLNSCLQLILTALDRVEDDEFFTSSLGVELINLRDNNINSLNPNKAKAIITKAEDIRVATRLSEIASTVMFQSLKDKQSRLALKQRFNFSDGQQCARDLFLCLQENGESWPEVCSMFQFDLSHSTLCVSCNHMHSLESSQMFIEIPVLEIDTNLNTAVEEFFNQSDLVEKKCEDGCKRNVLAEKRSQLVCGLSTKFLIVVLGRAIATLEENELVNHEITSTKEVFIR